MKEALSRANRAEIRFSRTRLLEFIATGRDLWRSGRVTLVMGTAREPVKKSNERSAIAPFPFSFFPLDYDIHVIVYTLDNPFSKEV